MKNKIQRFVLEAFAIAVIVACICFSLFTFTGVYAWALRDGFTIWIDAVIFFTSCVLGIVIAEYLEDVQP